MKQLRDACAAIAAEATHVQVAGERIAAYAASLPLARPPAPPDPSTELLGGSREHRAAFWLTLDAVNFGSGWFPTLRKPPGLSGHDTVASGIRRRFAARGRWSAAGLRRLRATDIAHVLGQDPEHELMELFARSLRDLGRRVAACHDGSFAAVADAAGGSAVALARRLGEWDAFADCSCYGGRPVPFLKRAQIAAADLHRAGIARFADLNRLTMFADNLVPHVLRLDGILAFAPGLVARIDAEQLIEHGSSEEIEIRACALHAVELIVAARPDVCAADVDQLLWHRGREPRYKAVPRHRSRCTAY
jgi:hypothetical protein